MELQANTTDLKVALENFEACLLTPLVSGEMEAWSNSLHAACCESLNCWQEEVTGPHVTQFKQMRKEDAEMGARVQQLQEEDEAITAQFQAYCEHTTSFCRRSPQMEPDEGRFEHVREETVQAGLALITRVRAQQQAVRTWFLEAFDRDRGEGD